MARNMYDMKNRYAQYFKKYTKYENKYALYDRRYAKLCKIRCRI
jgi:hypothetical protein